MTAIHTNKRITTGIPPAVAARIVELSMHNPDFGARRLLPLLKLEDIDISVSSIYNILKRHGLGNRENRLAKIKARDTLESPYVRADHSPVPVEEPRLSCSPKQLRKPMRPPQGPADTRKASQYESLSTSGRPAGTGSPGGLTLVIIDLLLLAALAYSGFHALGIIRRALPEPQAAAAAPGPVARKANRTEITSPRPLREYRTIWERHLFGPAGTADSVAGKTRLIEKISPARQDLGLVLLGTVVADNPDLSLAIIADRRLQNQAAYRQGDTTAKVRIKQILRDQVVIATAGGDELLAAGITSSGRHLKPFTNARRPSAGAGSSLITSANRLSDNNPWSFHLTFEELAAALADTGRVLQEATFSDYIKGEKPAGFKIAQIASNSVLKKMGLSDGDVIRALNGEPVTGPDQAADFLRTIAQGGVVEIKIKRRRRTRYLSLTIE